MSLDRARARAAMPQSRLSVVDCDIHPILRSESQILPFLPARWREHMQTIAATCARACTARSPIRACR